MCNDFLGHANPDLFWPFPQDLLALPACLLESLCSAALSSVLGQRRENVQMLVAGQNILYFAHTDSSHNPINLQPKTKVSQASSLQWWTSVCLQLLLPSLGPPSPPPAPAPRRAGTRARLHLHLAQWRWPLHLRVPLRLAPERRRPLKLTFLPAALPWRPLRKRRYSRVSQRRQQPRCEHQRPPRARRPSWVVGLDLSHSSSPSRNRHDLNRT